MMTHTSLDQRIAYNEGKRDGLREGEKKAHAQRCEVQGHDMEDRCTALFQFYRACKWCGKRE